MTQNLQTAPAHQVLAAAGKKYLRPGGKGATQQLLAWADFQPNETVLELAASFGYSAIALAQQYGVKVIGVEKNPESVKRACANIRAAGLEDQVEVIEGDIFHLEAIPGQFDYVLAEAILSMQSAVGKKAIVSEIAKKLKPGGKLLAHELLAQNRQEEIHRDLAQVIRTNSTPLSNNAWVQLCETAGLQLQKSQTGEMGLLNPQQLVRDEGLLNTLQIAWNVMTKPQVRQRVLQMRSVFQKYRQELGYIIFCAEAPQV